jgi:hypothetical protein
MFVRLIGIISGPAIATLRIMLAILSDEIDAYSSLIVPLKCISDNNPCHLKDRVQQNVSSRIGPFFADIFGLIMT